MSRNIASRLGAAIYGFSFAVALVLCGSCGAMAQPVSGAAVATPPTPVIVVVDVQRIMRDSLAGKSIQSQLSSQRNSVQKEFAKREQDLRTVNGDLAREQNTLAPDAFAQKRKDFEQRVEDFRKDASDREQAFARTQEDAQNRVLQVFINVVQDIARERGANLVLSKSAVVLVAQPFDITDDAMRRLDQRMPSIAVSAPRATTSDYTPALVAQPPAKKR